MTDVVDSWDEATDAKRLSLSELKPHLWEAANILRGPIDQADFKSYIFPLMFFKRISDVYDEEFEQALERVRRRPRVRRLRREPPLPDPGGRALDTTCASAPRTSARPSRRAMREIEKANPDTLYGIFGDAQWTNKDKLPDRAAARPDRALLEAAAVQRRRRAGRVRQRLRVPHQAVRRPVQQEGRRVLHAALGRADAGQHPRPAGGRDRLRPGVRHRRHADRGHRTRQGRRRPTRRRCGASSTARRRS